MRKVLLTGHLFMIVLSPRSRHMSGTLKRRAEKSFKVVKRCQS